MNYNHWFHHFIIIVIIIIYHIIVLLFMLFYHHCYHYYSIHHIGIPSFILFVIIIHYYIILLYCYPLYHIFIIHMIFIFISLFIAFILFILLFYHLYYLHPSLSFHYYYSLSRKRWFPVGKPAFLHAVMWSISHRPIWIYNTYTMRFCFHANGIDVVRNEIRLHTNPIVLLCKDPWCKCVETMYLCKSIHKELLIVCKQKSNLLRQVRVIALANVTSHTRGRTTMWRNETESAGGECGNCRFSFIKMFVKHFVDI